MTLENTDLTGLLGSRICHDLISPIGAIDNGLELLGMGPGAAGPELDLISGSVTSAKARILYYRIAFGMGDDQQAIGSSELCTAIAGYIAGLRMSVSADTAGDVERIDAKLLCLLLLCCETAMPFGGDVQVTRIGEKWDIRGQAEKLKLDSETWGTLTGESSSLALTPKMVHFALAAQTLKKMGRVVHLDHTPLGFHLTA